MNKNPMFNFEGYEVRVVMVNEQHWFVAADVLRGLGLNREAAAACRVLDADEKQVYDCRQSLRKEKGQYAAFTTLITESGMWKLVLRAHPGSNPRVARFQNWVTREVLPALRKDGMYVMGEEKVKTGEMSEDEFILKAMTLLQKKTERLTEERDTLRSIVDDNLISLTLDAWSALNSHYLTPQERGRMGWVLRKRREAVGVTLPQEHRKVTLASGRVKQTHVYIYPKVWLDEAAKSLGIPINMKFDLVEKVA